MPEMPEVQGLVDFLRERVTGLTITRVSVANIAALKTYDPPVDALKGAEVTGAARHGKFLDLSTTVPRTPPMPAPRPHLIFHLAKAGWLRWYDHLPATDHPTGEDPDRAADRARATAPASTSPRPGTKKSLAVYVARDPGDVPGHRPARPRPARPRLHRATTLAGLLAGRRTQIKGVLRDQSVHRGRRQRLLRRDPPRREDVAVRARRDPHRRRRRHALLAR